MINYANFKCGYVAITGKPNVGKSTLLNNLIGEKISITTPKPQTTRHKIKGILNRENEQVIFLDTPGYVVPRYELHHKMLEYISLTITDADLLIFISDGKFPTDYDKMVLDIFKKHKKPKLAVINKIDIIDDSTLKDIEEILSSYQFDGIFKISALKNTNLDLLLKKIIELIPYSPPFFSQDDLSDLPVRFFAEEIVREKIFLLLKDEIPYSSTVVIEKFEELENKININCNIWLERKTQRIILIGKNGENLKKIRELSERDLYKFLGKRVKLNLWVKIKPNWRKQKNSLKEFGYI